MGQDNQQGQQQAQDPKQGDSQEPFGSQQNNVQPEGQQGGSAEGSGENQNIGMGSPGDDSTMDQEQTTSQEQSWRPTDDPIGQAEGTTGQDDSTLDRSAGTESFGQGAASGQGGGL